MSNLNNVPQLYWSDYPNNSGVRLVYTSSYPNNPGVLSVGMTSDYPNNSNVMHVYRSNYENNPGVQKIYMTGCFPESELVNTSSDSYVPIGSIKIGDKISSWDADAKKQRYTAVAKIHKYTVNDIMHFNNAMRVSSSHPLLVVENDKNGMPTPKWKVAFDVCVGDKVIGAGGKLIAIKTKSRHWYNDFIEVINLSTDGGVPFLVGNFVARAENAMNNILWSDAPLTQKLAA